MPVAMGLGMLEAGQVCSMFNLLHHLERLSSKLEV